MKSLIIIGFVLLGLGALLFYIFGYGKTIDFGSIYGVLAGVGVGLIIGGLVGYVSKGNAVKEARNKKELERLQKEKLESNSNNV